MSESRTIQLWPGGKSVTFRREADSIVVEPPRWRIATPEESEAIEVELLAERLMKQDVLACQSCLVDSLLKSDFDGFSYEEVENVYPKFDGKAATECREFIDDLGSESDYPNDSNPFLLESDTLRTVGADFMGEAIPAAISDKTIQDKLFAAIDADEWGDVEDWREAARQLADPHEIFEWWLVSEHLARKLVEIGEPILDNGLGVWWGRTCSGQGVLMDGTLQEVARAMRRALGPLTPIKRLPELPRKGR